MTHFFFAQPENPLMSKFITNPNVHMTKLLFYILEPVFVNFCAFI